LDGAVPEPAVADPTLPDAGEIDGRVRRGERNRIAIVDALLACYEDGRLRPSASEIAERAGVSVRSLHNHFDDMESLRAELAQRQWERYQHLAELPDPQLGRAERIAELVARRARLYEALTPVRRAALLSAHESRTIAANLDALNRLLRSQLAVLFARELDGDADRLDAVDAVCSWDAWNRLRSAQGCSVSRAQRVLVQVLDELLKGSPR
jgi:AcrR family transcriptional regulator